MRIAANIFIFGLIIFAPSWLYVPALLLGIFLFPFFVEGIILAFLIDLFYGPARSGEMLWGLPLTVCAAGAVLLSIFVREQLRPHA